MATHESRSLRQRVHARPAWLIRALAPILGLTLSTAFALTLPHAMPSTGQAAPPQVERVDLHWSSIDSEETEVNLAVGTGDDCQTTLTLGQYCLRYSVTQEDQPKDIGFGVIPSSAVRINGPTLAIRLDTTQATFHHLFGSGGTIDVTVTPGRLGSPKTARGHTTSLAAAEAGGAIDGFRLARTQLQAAVLYADQ
jgi:hypothetical protein